MTVKADGGLPVGCVACPPGYRSVGGVSHACQSCDGVQCAAEGQSSFAVTMDAGWIEVLTTYHVLRVTGYYYLPLTTDYLLPTIPLYLNLVSFRAPS